MTVECNIEIKNEHGLHLRAAAMVAKAARDFDADIKFRYKDKTVDAKSTVGLVTLGAPRSGMVMVEASGDDADGALNAIVSVLDGNEFQVHSVD